MTELERIAGCAREQSDVILNAKILPGKYLVNFQPAPTLSRHDACCMGMGDNKHFPMGTEPLRLGFTGVAKAARENTGKDTLGVATLQAIDQVYTALAQLHEKVGLSPDQPRNFIEALQVFYTAWRFRSTHGTASIGRLDQYLYPFYQMDHPDHDLALGALTECWEYLNEIASGDTLITMLLGGTDEKGQDAQYVHAAVNILLDSYKKGFRVSEVAKAPIRHPITAENATEIKPILSDALAP